MTVRQLLESTDSAELTEWMAYFRLERERAAGLPADDDPSAAFVRVFGQAKQPR